jgi:Protein of unknown function (DUF3592)
MKALILLKYVVLSITLVLFSIAGYFFYETYTIIEISKKAQGHVTQITPRSSQNNIGRAEILFYPSVKFTTNKGQTITFESTFGNHIPTRVLGEKVMVLYNPDAPKQAQIDTFIEVWYKVIISASISGLFVLFSIISIMIAPNPKRKS